MSRRNLCVAPGAYAPVSSAPGAYGPVAGYPPAGFPTAVGPAAVAPVQRVVHPTRNTVTRSVTRYPIEHILPVHNHHIRDHVREHYYRPVYTNSVQDCCYDINCGCGGPRRRW